MLGTQTAELESHNVRGPSGSATHTAAIVLHADLGSKGMQNKHSASSSAFSEQLSECPEILLKSENSSLSEIIFTSYFFFFCSLSFLGGTIPVFLPKPLFLLFSVFATELCL